MAVQSKIRRDLIVIGASAGGVDALKRVVSRLPEDIPATILIVLHVWANGPSLLPQILNHVGPLTSMHPFDREELAYGRVFIAPPDFHLVLEPGIVRVVKGPKENRHRPAVDPLFRSAAAIYGSRVIACILTGAMDDGTAGCLAVRRHGGVVIVQDPSEAQHSGMPLSVMENMPVDYVLPLDQIPARLIELVGVGSRTSTAAPFRPDDYDAKEAKLGEFRMDAIEDLDRPGKPSVYACPDCHGTLWEVDDDGLLRFRCRTGHAYTATSLAIEQSERLEQALWTALRALEESAGLHRRMADRARHRGHGKLASEHSVAADHKEDSARAIRTLILEPRDPVETAGEEVVI